MLARGYQGEVRVFTGFSFAAPGFSLDNFFIICSCILILGEPFMNVLNNENIFEVKNLDYDYPGNITALKQVSFTVKPEEVVALVGANGSGKSTLLKLMDGLIFPKAGELRAFGKPLSEEGLKEKVFAGEFRRKIGMVFQDPDIQLFPRRSGTKSPSGRCNWESPKESYRQGAGGAGINGDIIPPAASSLSAFGRGEKEGLAGLSAFTATASAAPRRANHRIGPLPARGI